MQGKDYREVKCEQAQSIKNKVISWRKAVVKLSISRPKGYWTAQEIAKDTGLSIKTVRERLLKARQEGLLDAIQVLEKGHIIWVYKE